MSPAAGSLTAADLMQTDVVTIEEKSTLQDAMDLMVENHVTGLPVLNRRGKCIGVISSSDILSYEQDHSEYVAEANEDMATIFDQESQRWENMRLSTFALEEFADLPVAEIMTRKPMSVAPHTPVAEVAALMVEKDIHRIVVVNDEQYLLGVISAFDFVRLAAE